MIPQNEPDYGIREKQALMEYMDSGGWLTEHRQTREFEKIFTEFLEVKYAVAVPNGTIALAASIMALDIKGEIILPDYSILASATSIELAGAIPKLVDVDNETHCLHPDKIEKAINGNTKAIMIIPNNGRTPKYLKRLLHLAKQHNLKIIEDSCQCLGSKWKNKYFGTIGDVGCFSLSHHKIVTTGQGGMIVTNNDKLYDKICRLKNFGRSTKSELQEYSRPGFNFKFNDILASIGIVQIQTIKQKLIRKKEIYNAYRENLDGIVKFPKIRDGNILSMVDIMVDNPGILQSYLLDKGIETRLFYPPIHSYFDNLSDKDFPNTIKISKHGLWLPSSSKLRLDTIKWICDKIKGYINARKQ